MLVAAFKAQLQQLVVKYQLALETVMVISNCGRSCIDASACTTAAASHAQSHAWCFLQVGWTVLTVGSSLAVALLVPDQAEKIYAVVGATAVCCVCYVVPVYIQLQMHQRHRQPRKVAQVRVSSEPTDIHHRF